MKFTENPRRWRKVLMYFALSKILAEQEGSENIRPMVDSAVRSLFWGTLTGTVIAVPTAAITVLIQLAAAIYFRPTMPELISVLNQAVICGAAMGWFVNWACVANANEKYLRKPSDTPPLIYAEVPIAMIAAGVGLPGLLLLVYALLALFNIPGGTVPNAVKHLLPSYIACLLAAWPAALIWKRLMILARQGEAHLSPATPSPGQVPTAPRRRLLFRRGRGVTRPLPVHGPAQAHMPPPKW